MSKSPEAELSEAYVRIRVALASAGYPQALRTAEGGGDRFERTEEALALLVDERDELRLEILALRGDKAGAVSERWVWAAPCWRIRGADGGLLAKVATTKLLAWTRNGDIETGGIEQATSVRDGMRRCEARLRRCEVGL